MPQRGSIYGPAKYRFWARVFGRNCRIRFSGRRKFVLCGRASPSLPFFKGQNIGLSSVTGAYAEYLKVIPDQVVKIPDEIDDLNAALVEPLAVGLHAVKMAGNIAQQNILIIGAGPIGLACATWCKFFGARNIVISEMSPARIDMAKKLGFTK